MASSSTEDQIENVTAAASDERLTKKDIYGKEGRGGAEENKNASAPEASKEVAGGEEDAPVVRDGEAAAGGGPSESESHAGAVADEIGDSGSAATTEATEATPVAS